MKPRPGLPCGVRLTAGLGGAGGTTALALAAETVAELERRATLSIGVEFTSGSVPELNPIRRRLCVPPLAWCCVAGERPAEGRAATTRLTPSLLAVPKMALATGAVVLCSTDFPARSSEARSEQAVQSGAIRSGRN